MQIKIGELARRVGCEVVTIRFYEQKGLLPEPSRSSGNFRLYGEAHIERLQFIRHCRSLDLSLGEIQALLEMRDNPARDCIEVTTLLGAHIQQIETRIEALSQLKQDLIILHDQCAGARPVESCEILRGLAGPSVNVGNPANIGT